MTHSAELWQGKIKEDKKFHLFLLVIWPVMAFAAACRNFGSRYSRNIILCFYALYGFTFVIDPIMDGQRYADQLTAAYESSADVSEIFDTFFGEEGDLDLLQPVLTFVVSRLTSDYHILFVFFALIFGFFQLRSLHALYVETDSAKSRNTAVLLIFMALLLPIFSINGFRMWTATWVFFYGCFNLIYLRKKIYYLVSLSAIMVHFSFLTINVVLLLYLLLGNRRYIYAFLAAASFSLSELPLESIKTYVTALGGGLNTKFSAYTHKRYMKETFETQSQSAWFMQLSNPLLKYFIIIGLGIIFFKMTKNKFSKNFESFYCVTLLFLTYANIASLVPSGGRFMTVFFVFGIAVMALYYSTLENSAKYAKLVLIGALPMVLYSLINIRIAATTINVMMFMPGPVAVFFNNIDIPLL